MALTSNHANNELIKFQRNLRSDFIRGSRFDPYMGDTGNAIWAQISDLSSNGKEIRIPYGTQLTGPGVGAGTLTGNEETMSNYGFPMWADWARNGVTYDVNTENEASYPVRATARQRLRDWQKRTLRDDMIDAMLSIPTGTIQAGRLSVPGNRVNGVKWSAATTGQKNTWVTANSDRVLFGNAISNYSTTFATAAANVDTTNDRMTASVLSLAKELIQATGYGASATYNGKPKISPWMIEGLDEEYYVCFVGSRAMRDLRTDATMYQANRDARERENNPEKTNPIFTGGALLWNGIIIREIPEITFRLLQVGIGASTSDVEPYFMCGSGAFAHAIGASPSVNELDQTDYDFRKGVSTRSNYGCGKPAMLMADSSLVDWGVLTGFISAPAST